MFVFQKIKKSKELHLGEMDYIDYKHKIEFGKKEYDEINNYCLQKNWIGWLVFGTAIALIF